MLQSTRPGSREAAWEHSCQDFLVRGLCSRAALAAGLAAASGSCLLPAGFRPE